MKKWAVLACLWLAVAVLGLGGLAGCATTLERLQTVSHAQVDEAIAQGEQAVAVARAALALYEEAARIAGKTEIEIATVRDVWAHRIAVMEAALEDLRAARDQWRPAQK
jgi:uncharacterized NAD-dependent epimerase/dehydratase family protein